MWTVDTNWIEEYFPIYRTNDNARRQSTVLITFPLLLLFRFDCIALHGIGAQCASSWVTFSLLLTANNQPNGKTPLTRNYGWIDARTHSVCTLHVKHFEMLAFVYCHVPGALCHCAVCICAQRQHQQWRQQQ